VASAVRTAARATRASGRPPLSTRAGKGPDDGLLGRLFVEFFQTEESALEHPRIEGERLGESPPARAMRAVSAHAARVRPELRRLAAAEGLSTRSFGKWIGEAFSIARRLAVDRTLDREKSYRSTLLGMYHGVDLVRLLRAAARAQGRQRVASFCEEWLGERAPLIEAASLQLDWFGEHPRIAVQRSTSRLRDASSV
jgi:hypothetical protein